MPVVFHLPSMLPKIFHTSSFPINPHPYLYSSHCPFFQFFNHPSYVQWFIHASSCHPSSNYAPMSIPMSTPLNHHSSINHPLDLRPLLSPICSLISFLVFLLLFFFKPSHPPKWSIAYFQVVCVVIFLSIFLAAWSRLVCPLVSVGVSDFIM